MLKRPVFVHGIAIAAALLASGGSALAQDAQAGKRVFNRCGACHSIEAGKNKTGPTLFAIFGRKAGGVSGFSYSPAMTASGIFWDAEKLDAFVKDSKGMIPGNRMPFPPLPDAKDRADLVAYLKTLK